MAYQPIEHYGVIGNLRTAALVNGHGSLDWLCFPHFDSPAVFAAILDDAKGGRFQIAPVKKDVRWKQFYWPDTNILITRFLHPEGLGEIEDYMPVGPRHANQVVRRLRVVRGSMRFRISCEPAFDFGRAKHETRQHGDGVEFVSPHLTLRLAATVPLTQTREGVEAEISLNEGEAAVVILSVVDPDGPAGSRLPIEPPDLDAADRLFHETSEYWHQWVAQCTYRGRWREIVTRSALTLKLMTFEPTGAIVAAPTCSLPESIGGVRNWDYRYTWIRDAAFTVYALMRIGFNSEAAAFMEFLGERCARPRSRDDHPLQLMYRIDGGTEIEEYELPHLEGYRGSGPVRVGNAAYQQLQLDIYGELLDACYLSNKYSSPMTYEMWKSIREIVDWVCENWRHADEGIWEVRGGAQQFTFSKVQCWVAVDRAIRLIHKRSFPGNVARWLQTRDAIYEEIMKRGWNHEMRMFTQTFDGDTLDASNLLMPLMFFTGPDDPRTLATIDAIRKPLREGGLAADGLVYRYDVERSPDGLPGDEGTFNVCSFWLVEALTRAGRRDPKRLADARLLFEHMLGYSNHLGLYAEQTGLSGEALGNFPQALTHLSLISAAFNLDRALDGGHPGM